jgi:hypothetical protein
MYRKDNGSLGFSFTKFVNAAVPNLFADESPSYAASLVTRRRDMCYVHQMAAAAAAAASGPVVDGGSASAPASPSPSPVAAVYALDQRSFYVAGVVDSERLSKKVHKALTKHQILRESDGTVDTHQIGPKFPHQLAMLDVGRQKNLVGLLFWWEEECQRLRKLDAEETELNVLVAEAEARLKSREEQDQRQDQRLARPASAVEEPRRGETEETVGGPVREPEATLDETSQAERHDPHVLKSQLDQLKFARERVRMKKRQSPGQRHPDVEADRDDIVMAFHGHSRSVSAVSPLPPPHPHAQLQSGAVGMAPGSGTPQTSSQHQERPPRYFPST